MEIISETIRISRSLSGFYYWVKDKNRIEDPWKIGKLYDDTWITGELYQDKNQCILDAKALDKKNKVHETPHPLQCHISGFLQVIPDSQSFDNIEQILQYVKTRSNDEYLKVALMNTINNGFKLTK